MITVKDRRPIYLNDGDEDYNFVVDLKTEVPDYYWPYKSIRHFRVTVKAGGMKKARSIAAGIVMKKFPYNGFPKVLDAERQVHLPRTWWTNEYDNSIVFSRNVALRQVESVNHYIDAMRRNIDCNWSIQFIN